MDLLKVLLVILGAGGVFFLVSFVMDVVKHKDDLGKENPVLGFFIGLVTDFFDTLGIGSFAPTTLLFKVTKFLDTDKKIPGTLNVAHTVPVLMEAFLFLTGVKVEGVTLFSMIAAAIVGALIGARIVNKLPEKKIQLVMGVCLCVGASLLYLFISLGSLPWISILLALTFGLYSLCKKKIVLSPKASLLVETAIVSPIALIYMWYLGTNSNITFHTYGTSTLIYALLSGVVTAVPLMLFAKGAIDIPLYLLGILQYLPPTMQFFIGIFVYGEQLSIQKLISFIIIWIAVIVFCYSAVTSMKKQSLINKSHQK